MSLHIQTEVIQMLLYSVYLDGDLYVRAAPRHVLLIAEELELQGFNLVDAHWDRAEQAVYLFTGEY
jgi:hypothetical protein